MICLSLSFGKLGFGDRVEGELSLIFPQIRTKTDLTVERKSLRNLSDDKKKMQILFTKLHPGDSLLVNKLEVTPRQRAPASVSRQCEKLTLSFLKCR